MKQGVERGIELIVETIDTVMFDVPEEYHIDTAEFYRYAHEYYGA